MRIYYPTIEVTGGESIPAEGPALFVANHPNAMMDPVVIGIAVKRPVHFLAKAPLFEVPVFGKVMSALGMLPAYRAVDDATQVQRNVQSLANAAACLMRGEAVGIFPEGKSHDLLKLDQVKTGAARIAVQALNEGAKDLKIVPLGLNYEQKDRLFTSVWVRVGQVIDADAWAKLSESSAPGDDRKVVRALTIEIDHRLKETVIHFDEAKWEPFLDELEVLRPPPKELAGERVAALKQRKRIAEAMNHFLQNEPATANAMAERIARHRENLAGIGLTIRSPMVRLHGPMLLVRLKADALWMLLGFIPALAGTIHHLVPFAVTRLIARFFQTPGRSSIALSRLLVGLPIYGAWYAVVAWWMAKWFNPWVAGIWTALMPICGVLALHYWPRARLNARHWLQQVQMWMRPEQLRQLRHEQLQIRHELRKLAERFWESSRSDRSD